MFSNIGFGIGVSLATCPAFICHGIKYVTTKPFDALKAFVPTRAVNGSEIVSQNICERLHNVEDKYAIVKVRRAVAFSSAKGAKCNSLGQRPSGGLASKR
jgi:hypothetical protein